MSDSFARSIRQDKNAQMIRKANAQANLTLQQVATGSIITLSSLLMTIKHDHDAC
jgi:hypothetical protein